MGSTILKRDETKLYEDLPIPILFSCFKHVKGRFRRGIGGNMKVYFNCRAKEKGREMKEGTVSRTPLYKCLADN